MVIFVRRYMRRSQLALDLVEEWKVNHDHAMFALDIQEWVSECIDLGDLTKHVWSLFRELLMKDPNAAVIDESGRVIQAAVQRTLAIFEAVNELVQDASRKGFALQEVADFELARHETRAIMDKIKVVFMEPDPKMIEESLAAYKRGEYYTSEELLRAAQDGRFPAD